MKLNKAIEKSKTKMAIRIEFLGNDKLSYITNGIIFQTLYRGKISEAKKERCVGFIDWYPYEYFIHN